MSELTFRVETMEINLPDGRWPAVVVRLTNPGGGDRSVSRVSLCRKGVDAVPDMPAKFGVDPAWVIRGLPADRYQVRVPLHFDRGGELVSLERGADVRLAPGASAVFVLPLPFPGAKQFADGPTDDLFFAVTGRDVPEGTVPGVNVHGWLKAAVAKHGDKGPAQGVATEVHVPVTEEGVNAMRARAEQQQGQPGQP